MDYTHSDVANQQITGVTTNGHWPSFANTQSTAIDLVVSALIEAQRIIKQPAKSKTVKVTPKNGGRSYSFAYATLDKVIEAVRDPLIANGLWFTQTMAASGGKYHLVTKLLHKSGQWIASETPILVEDGGNQQFGSALTYMRRYALAAMFGLASEEDDDANTADGNEVAEVPRVSKPPADVKATAIVATAPTNPNTGKVEPHKIEFVRTKSGLGADYTTWGRSFLAGIDTAKTVDEASEWERENRAMIVDIAKAAPKIAERLTERIAEVYARIRSQKEAA